MLKITLPLLLVLCLVGCQSPQETNLPPQEAAIFEAPLPPKVDTN